MAKLLWLTDIHLNFLGKPGIKEFLAEVLQESPDAVLLGGDIGEARSLISYLQLLDGLQVPVYFVLGNHDFYGASIDWVRGEVSRFCGRSENLVWLSCRDRPVHIGATALVGHDGWADGRMGDFFGSGVRISDYSLIGDFIGRTTDERKGTLARLGDEAAGAIGRTLSAVPDRISDILVLTHVPPFREACWHQGKVSGKNWLPHFACKAVGDMLVEAMRTHPQRRMTVLCGHTHSSGEADILGNLHVKTGGAEYGQPRIQSVFEVS